MNKFNIINKNLSNLSNTSLSSVKGIVIFSNPDYYEKAAQYDGFDKVSFLNKDTKDFGYHYGMDQYDLVSYIPKQYQAICLPDAPTYISNGIFGGKPEESCISIHLFICPSHDYEETEKYFVSFVVKLMKDNNLKAEDIWRGFDLSSNNKGPFHMLDLDIWKAYLDIFKKFEDVSLDDYDSVSWDSPYKSLAEEKGVSIDEYVKSIYNDNLSNLDNYVGNFKPYDKGIQAALDAQNISIQEEIKNTDQKTGNHLKYQITHNPPGNGCNCMKRFDKLDAEEKAKDIKVEPIYPDLITPPGAEINVANGNSQAKTQSSSDTPLTVEEFEKRQKVFDINNFDNISKHTKGRPVNCDDPFPVDEQIKKLEQHYPKCKVDKVTYDFTEDNHLGSQLGAAMAKNYNMCYDMITEVSRRVETRLVKLENNLATVMRNLFRVGSRVNINCVYYGGQSIYGKKNVNLLLYI